jgi:hypothetical protein
MNKRALNATMCAQIFKETSVDYKNGSVLGVNLYRRLAYFDLQGRNKLQRAAKGLYIFKYTRTPKK